MTPTAADDEKDCSWSEDPIPTDDSLLNGPSDIKGRHDTLLLSLKGTEGVIAITVTGTGTPRGFH